MGDEQYKTNIKRDPLVDFVAVRDFSNQMLKKLNINYDKAHWSKASIEYHLNRLKEEVEELEEAINKSTITPEDVISECADVANFAMFIADIVNSKKTKEQQ